MPKSTMNTEFDFDTDELSDEALDRPGGQAAGTVGTLGSIFCFPATSGTVSTAACRVSGRVVK